MTKILVTNVEEGIFQLQINDPENKNRLSKELLSEFLIALETLAAKPTLKVLILTGYEEIFCAGGSLEILQQISHGKTDVKKLFIPVINKILSFPVPLIGALQGHALGGGLMFALCCDMLVASESSRYGVNFTDLGFTPGMGATSLLPALVGSYFANEMLLTAKFYKGRELRDRGLFNYVVSSEEVMSVTLDIARRIAEKPKHVLEMLKDTISLPRHQALQEAAYREDLMHKICFSYSSATEYIEATYLT